MLIPITQKVRIRISRPLWLEIDRAPQLELQFPTPPALISVPAVPAGYRLRIFNFADEDSYLRLLHRAGFVFSRKQLHGILSMCLPNGCFVVQHKATRDLVATMMARHVSSPEHPFGGRIDWLASDPEHRRRGLGAICARSAASRLLQSGYESIWVTTDDYRLAALKIFLAMGFKPCITPETKDRWKKVKDVINSWS